MANRLLNRLQVIPLTSNVDRLYPGEAVVTVNGERRKAMANQLTTVSTLRLRDMIASLSRDDVTAIDKAIRLQLAL